MLPAPADGDRLASVIGAALVVASSLTFPAIVNGGAPAVLSFAAVCVLVAAVAWTGRGRHRWVLAAIAALVVAQAVISRWPGLVDDGEGFISGGLSWLIAAIMTLLAAGSLARRVLAATAPAAGLADRRRARTYALLALVALVVAVPFWPAIGVALILPLVVARREPGVRSAALAAAAAAAAVLVLSVALASAMVGGGPDWLGETVMFGALPAIALVAILYARLWWMTREPSAVGAG